MGSEEDLYSAISTAIQTGALRNADCVNFRDCNVDADTNVTFQNVRKLINLINANYVSTALDSYRHLEFERASILISNAVRLWRLIRFAAEPFSAPGAYNDVLVLSAFLSKYDATSFQRLSGDDVKALEAALNQTAPVESGRISDADISAYVQSLGRLYSLPGMRRAAFFRMQQDEARPCRRDYGVYGCAARTVC